MSIKRSFLRRSTALAAVMGFAALISIAIPPHSAIADEGKKKHHHGDYDDEGRGYVVAPRYVFGGYYAPPPVVYYAPRAVYVVPQPRVIYEAPAPVYYGPPSLNITVPLR